MKAARKSGPTRGITSTRFSSARSRRPLRNPLQNRPERQVPCVPQIVAKRVFVEVGLQEFRADVVVDAADSALHQTPESFDSLGVNVAGDINLRAVTDAPMDVAEILESIVRNKIVGKHCARRQDVFLRQTVKSFLCGVRSYTRHNPANSFHRCGARPSPQPRLCDCRKMGDPARLDAVSFRRGTSHPSRPSNPPVPAHPRTRNSESGGTYP